MTPNHKLMTGPRHATPPQLFYYSQRIILLLLHEVWIMALPNNAPRLTQNHNVYLIKYSDAAD